MSRLSPNRSDSHDIAEKLLKIMITPIRDVRGYALTTLYFAPPPTFFGKKIRNSWNGSMEAENAQ